MPKGGELRNGKAGRNGPTARFEGMSFCLTLILSSSDAWSGVLRQPLMVNVVLSRKTISLINVAVAKFLNVVCRWMLINVKF